MALDALMKLEDNSDDGTNRHGKSNQKRPLYRQVVEILKTLNGRTTPADSSIPRSSAPGDVSFHSLHACSGRLP
jgi:hypothetical protein